MMLSPSCGDLVLLEFECVKGHNLDLVSLDYNTQQVKGGLRLPCTFNRRLAFKRCSSSGLNCIYLNPYIELKLIDL